MQYFDVQKLESVKKNKKNLFHISKFVKIRKF